MPWSVMCLAIIMETLVPARILSQYMALSVQIRIVHEAWYSNSRVANYSHLVQRPFGKCLNSDHRRAFGYGVPLAVELQILQIKGLNIG